MASAKEQIIAAAAAQNKVPARLLYGVWGAETNYGKNKSTSPAGAEGDFQFMPDTARSLGVNVNSFSSSAYGAAKYLAQLRRGSSSWHEAIAKYNAGPAGNLDNPETAAYVPKVFALSKGYGGPSAQSQLAGKLAGLGSTTSTTFDRAGFDQANKRSVLANFLSTQKGAGQNPLLTTGLLVPGQAPQKSAFTTKRTIATPSLGSAGSATSPTVVGTLQQIVEREAGISAHAKPYKWGGGHQAAGGSLAQSFDCSGAVSRALGINPRVASQFQSYGDAGPGKHVAIYAKSDHVIMATKTNGTWHFFGTSASNPGGGAGWIPLSALSKSYLAQFTVRHPPGL